jgi:hypothetical protein
MVVIYLERGTRALGFPQTTTNEPIAFCFRYNGLN